MQTVLSPVHFLFHRQCFTWILVSPIFFYFCELMIRFLFLQNNFLIHKFKIHLAFKRQMRSSLVLQMFFIIKI